jgi:hypothetical protein
MAIGGTNSMLDQYGDKSQNSPLKLHVPKQGISKKTFNITNNN